MSRLALRLAPVAAAIALLAAGAPACATEGSPRGVVCALSATPLMFGEYVAYEGAPSDFTATIVVTCISSSAAVARWAGVLILTGQEPLSGRRLKARGHTLDYALFTDPARTTPWGDGAAGLSLSGAVSPRVPFRQAITVYGRIPARQVTAGVGRYTDRISAILDYDEVLDQGPRPQ